MVLALLALVGYAMLLPDRLFTDPTSTVVWSRQGQLMGARIASDGQWRFPAIEQVPEKFEACILGFEDRGFRSHFGVSIRGTARAIVQNIRAGRVVSGGSTITMQTIRLSRKGKSRTIREKLIEWIYATRLEWSYSKDDILSLYTSHAPFGGNVVGLGAAAWRYFGTTPDQLTWSESATLAVLPNAPSLIYPGKNQELLRAKRDGLLTYLLEEEVLDSLTYELALAEPLPGRPYGIPQDARHLLQRAEKDGLEGQSIRSSLDYRLQRQAQQVVQVHSKHNKKNRIRNAAVLLLDLESGEALAYVGNIDSNEEQDESYNDLIGTPRSSGSILKPFLYGAALDEGMMTPRNLLRDVPINYQGFSPKNYDEQFNGAVFADEALSRSLNIPAVDLLQDFRVERFIDELHDFGFSTIDRGAEVYGLSLILGGAEVTLWDLARAYRSMALSSVHSEKVVDISYVLDEGQPLQRPDWSAGAGFLTLKALSNVTRPRGEQQWDQFLSNRKISWKTGTSYGFRDAWAVGVNAKYVVAVWVGNANGEGQPGISGLEVAAPIMFEILNRLPSAAWFDRPEADLVEVDICRYSGMRAGMNCEGAIREEIQRAGLNTAPCSYCRRYLVNSAGERVNRDCSDDWHAENRFVLPPIVAWYYADQNANYQGPPKYSAACEPVREEVIRLIYPKPQSMLYIPRDLDGEKQAVVVKAAHLESDATLYWHLGDTYLGSTENIHQMSIQKGAGDYQLRLFDDAGRTFHQTIHIRE